MGDETLGTEEELPLGEETPGTTTTTTKNDKDDAQPPRLRRTKQASPTELKLYFYILIFMFSQPPSTSCERKREQGGLDKKDGELYGGGGVNYTVGNFGILFIFNFITSF